TGGLRHTPALATAAALGRRTHFKTKTLPWPSPSAKSPPRAATCAARTTPSRRPATSRTRTPASCAARITSTPRPACTRASRSSRPRKTRAVPTGGAAKEPPMSTTTDLRTCFIGDSYVAGAGDDTGLGWVGRVTARARADGYDLTAYNLGVRRDTAADAA